MKISECQVKVFAVFFRYDMKLSGYEGYRIGCKNLSHKSVIFSDLTFWSLLNCFLFYVVYRLNNIVPNLPQIRRKQEKEGGDV